MGEINNIRIWIRHKEYGMWTEWINAPEAQRLIMVMNNIECEVKYIDE